MNVLHNGLVGNKWAIIGESQKKFIAFNMALITSDKI